MKIWLDRRACSLWDAACESDFAEKFLGDEVLPTACSVMLLEEDEKDEIVFYIRDRDGSHKELIVDDSNLALAIDSWIKAYARQHPENHSVDVSFNQLA